MTESDSLPPSNMEAEQAVIGALLIDGGESVSLVRPIIDPDHFFFERNRWVYEACLSSYDETGAIDTLTVTSLLETRGQLKDIGGAAYIVMLQTKTPSISNIQGHARMIRAAAYRRDLKSFASHAARLAHSEETNIQDIHREVEDQFRRVGVGQMTQPRTARHLAADLVNEIGAGPRPRFSSGMSLLDRMCDGAYGPGQMVIFCAYTNQGKSHLAAQAARAAADIAPTLYISLESTPADVRDMMFAARCNVPETTISDRVLTEDQQMAVYQEVANWEHLPLEIDTIEYIDMIRARMTEMSARYDFRPGMLFVDDVDSLAEFCKGPNSYERLKVASVQLLTLATQTGWGVVGLKQLLSPSPDMTRGVTNSDTLYNMLKPQINMVEGGRSIVQKGGTIIGMLGADWIQTKLYSQFQHNELPAGIVKFYGLKFRKRRMNAVVEGPMRWNAAIPRFEDVIETRVDLDDDAVILGMNTH